MFLLSVSLRLFCFGCFYIESESIFEFVEISVSDPTVFIEGFISGAVADIFLVLPLLGGMVQFELCSSQMGGENHHLDSYAHLLVVCLFSITHLRSVVLYSFVAVLLSNPFFFKHKTETDYTHTVRSPFFIFFKRLVTVVLSLV